MDRSRACSASAFKRQDFGADELELLSRKAPLSSTRGVYFASRYCLQMCTRLAVFLSLLLLVPTKLKAG